MAFVTFCKKTPHLTVSYTDIMEALEILESPYERVYCNLYYQAGTSLVGICTCVEHLCIGPYDTRLIQICMFSLF